MVPSARYVCDVCNEVRNKTHQVALRRNLRAWTQQGERDSGSLSHPGRKNPRRGTLQEGLCPQIPNYSCLETGGRKGEPTDTVSCPDWPASGWQVNPQPLRVTPESGFKVYPFPKYHDVAGTRLTFLHSHLAASHNATGATATAPGIQEPSKG